MSALIFIHQNFQVGRQIDFGNFDYETGGGRGLSSCHFALLSIKKAELGRSIKDSSESCESSGFLLLTRLVDKS
jgi:hypothetical protein